MVCPRVYVRELDPREYVQGSRSRYMSKGLCTRACTKGYVQGSISMGISKRVFPKDYYKMRIPVDKSK